VIKRTSTIDVEPSYGELERHYGFVADPAKAGKPRHKGKVEKGCRLCENIFWQGEPFEISRKPISGLRGREKR